jgi:hypothetical protein
VRVASGCGLLVSALARRTDFAAWYSGIRDLAMQRWRCRPPPL